MKLITQRDLIKGVYERWLHQYPEPQPEDKKQIATILSKLDLSVASAKEIDEIIGNNTWTTELCQECDNRKENYLVLGEDMEFVLCLDCARDIAWVLK